MAEGVGASEGWGDAYYSKQEQRAWGRHEAQLCDPNNVPYPKKRQKLVHNVLKDLDERKIFDSFVT